VPKKDLSNKKPAQKPQKLRDIKRVVRRMYHVLDQSVGRGANYVDTPTWLGCQEMERIEDVRSFPYFAHPLTENSIGVMQVPVGAAEHFVVNGRESHVPMATLECGVVAGASYAAKLCKPYGGFTAKVYENVVTAQIRYDYMPSNEIARSFADRINADSAEVIRIAMTSADPVFATMRNRGGGLIGYVAHVERNECAVIVNVTINALEAMGANLATRMAEAIDILIGASLNRGKATAVIVTNADQGPLVHVVAHWRMEDIGRRVAMSIERLCEWAAADPTRATTHNKGLLNGLLAAALAAGQDVPAIAAAAAFQMTGGKTDVQPLTTFTRKKGMIVGELSMRIPLGTVGGGTRHRASYVCRRIMCGEDKDVTVKNLAAVIGSAALASNFASLRMLADEGVLAALDRLRKK